MRVIVEISASVASSTNHTDLCAVPPQGGYIGSLRRTVRKRNSVGKGELFVLPPIPSDPQSVGLNTDIYGMHALNSGDPAFLSSPPRCESHLIFPHSCTVVCAERRPLLPGVELSSTSSSSVQVDSGSLTIQSSVHLFSAGSARQ